jgi:uridine kinase
MTPERSGCLETLVGLILRVDRPHPVRVAIDGPDAAGKTILADELVPLIERSGQPVVRASIDGFHRPRKERIALGPESPEGYFHDSFDDPALRASLLDPLGPGGKREFRRRVFDFRTDQPVAGPTEVAPANAVLVLDGVFLLRSELIDLWDFSVFVAVPFAETRRRAAARDLARFGNEEDLLHRYAVRYVPGQQIYFRLAQPQTKADAVWFNEDPARASKSGPILDCESRATHSTSVGSATWSAATTTRRRDVT